MTAALIDGKARAARLKEDVAAAAAELAAGPGVQPGLAVVLARMIARNKAALVTA